MAIYFWFSTRREPISLNLKPSHIASVRHTDNRESVYKQLFHLSIRSCSHIQIIPEDSVF
ncbi:hypothetical protein C0J52_11135 [Blattella germanica]|nr:hypothetical protein C0J52_11135 [Blattella germanica]